jgi:riboflavin synthase
MFTGIIETIGKIMDVIPHQTNRSFQIESTLGPELKIDQSLSHNGVCLTVESIHQNIHQVTAVEETLLKTTLSDWKPGDFVNLERCVPMNGRLDGHLVQGHVDGIGICEKIENRDGSWLFTFSFDAAHAPLLVEKGSVAINGTSLTCFNVSDHTFQVAIIPYTFNHTTLNSLVPGTAVHLEFDVIAKYMQRYTNLLQSGWKSITH